MLRVDCLELKMKLILLLCLLPLCLGLNTHKISFETTNDYQNMFPLKVKELELSVKSFGDAKIILSTETNSEVYYVINLGKDGNSKSSIQKGDIPPIPENIYEAPFFQGDTYIAVTIIMNDEEGSITVKKGDAVILTYKDPYYTKMEYFGVSTPDLGEWILDFLMFDCDCCYV